MRRSGSIWTVAVAGRLAAGLIIGSSLPPARAEAEVEKERAIAAPVASAADARVSWDRPAQQVGGSGFRHEIAGTSRSIPLLVVGGTPYEMGYRYGRLMQGEIQQYAPRALAVFQEALQVDAATLDRVWAVTAAYTDDRIEQEILGLAAGSGVAARVLQHIHCLPLLSPYSCSSVAAWGGATADGHLYLTRDLDWALEAGAHDFPVVVLYLPARGIPHVNPTFCGMVGAHTGLNAAGIALAEMGDSPAREMPYDLHAPHFTAYFRSFLYDATGLEDLLERFRGLPMTKRYHFVFGDGIGEQGAVKIRAHAPDVGPERVRIWRDNDASDEFAPRVLPQVVYNDEGRGAFPVLRAEHGRYTPESLVALANRIATRGGNVMNVVYDATALRLWFSYARGASEAFAEPYFFLDLAALDQDRDGRGDLVEGGADADGDGIADFAD